ESWTFTCPGLVNTPTENVADIVGQPSDATGAPLPGVPTVHDDAEAFVDVLRSGIAINKLALVPVVVDPAAPVVAGPDLPRRPAQYTYEVTNTGDAPLALSPNPPGDDTCTPLTFEGGDVIPNGLLDVGEVWEYTCNTLLTRSQGTPPPVGAESAFVTNHVS